MGRSKCTECLSRPVRVEDGALAEQKTLVTVELLAGDSRRGSQSRQVRGLSSSEYGLLW